MALSRNLYHKINAPFPPFPLDGPVLEEGVLPDLRVQSNWSDLDCFHLQKPTSKSQDGSEKWRCTVNSQMHGLFTLTEQWPEVNRNDNKLYLYNQIHYTLSICSIRRIRTGE